jgi:hypothetical protein
MSNAVALRPEQHAPATLADIERMAVSVAKSGLFPGMKTTEQAMALMLLAHAEGMHPAIAARDFDVINGRPAKKAEAMMRDFMRSGGKVEWHELSDAVAEATFSHPQGGALRLKWDMDRAKKAELGGKGMWLKYPRQMLRARLISEGVRTVFPLATSGMYSAEEVSDIPTPPMRDVTPESPKPTAPAGSAQAKLDALAGETPNARPAATLYAFDPMDGSDPVDHTGLEWLSVMEVSLPTHDNPGALWKANERTFYAIQEAATTAGAKKAIAACSRVAVLAHRVTDTAA